MLLGDSITEAWRGTSYGNPSERTAGVPAVLHQTLGKQFDASPLVLAISGDQTQHLLWRLQLGGELIYGTKELEDGRDGSLSRLQLAGKYAF